MADPVIPIIKGSVGAYETDNVILINDFSAREETVCTNRHSVLHQGIPYKIEDPKNISGCTNYSILSRFNEKRADNSCEIAENIYNLNAAE